MTSDHLKCFHREIVLYGVGRATSLTASMLSQLVISDHATKRMAEQQVHVADVRNVLLNGEVIRNYPEDRPHESRLMLGFVSGHPLHVVAADAHELDTTFVITVYWPDAERWKEDFKTKRRDE